MITHHTYVQVFTAEGWQAPAWPLLLSTFVLTFIYFFGFICSWVLCKLFPSYKIAELKVDEDIVNYWTALDPENRKWTIMEEGNSRSLLRQGLKMMTDESFQRVKDAHTTRGTTLVGCHTYDLLANPLYSTAFQYFSVSIPDREKYIIDDDDDESNDMAQSNMVRVALNMGYLFQTDSMRMNFDKNTFTVTHKEALMDKVNFIMKSAVAELH